MPRAFRIGSISGAAEAWPAQFYLASTTRQLFPMAPPTSYLPPTCPFGDIGGCQVYPHWVVSLLHFIPMGFNLSAFMNTIPFVSSGPPSYPRAPLRVLGLPFVSSGSPSCPRAPLHILGLPFVFPHSLIFLVSPDASPVICARAYMPLDPSIILFPSGTCLCASSSFLSPYSGL